MSFSNSEMPRRLLSPATVSSLAQLCDEIELPLVGVEPGVKPASLLSQSGRVAVLATEHTTNSHHLKQLVTRYANHCHVQLQACPGWDLWSKLKTNRSIQ